MLKRLFTVLSLLLLCSCSFNNPYSLKDDSFINSDKKGAVIISVRRPYYGLANPQPKYFIKDEDAYFTCITPLSKSTKTLSFLGNDFLEALELPAGKYEIYYWEMFFNLGLVQWQEYAESRCSIPFTVEPGKINYLGEMALDGYEFQFRNMEERDLAIAYDTYPFLQRADRVYHPLSCTEGCKTMPKTANKLLVIPLPIIK